MISRFTSRFGSGSKVDNSVEDANTPTLGPTLRKLDPKVQSALEAAGVPLISCSACPSPCDPAHPEATPDEIHSTRLLTAWSKQDIDLDEEMFPSNSPFLRHVLISTGKKDWVKDVASVSGSLAQLFEGFVEEEEKRQKKETKTADTDDTSQQPSLPHGCWQTTTASTAPTRLFIGNASHISSSSRENGNSVMLFPDYVLISDVPDAMNSTTKKEHTATARWAFDRYISPRANGNDLVTLATSQDSPPRRWVLPHRAIVVLCSHHKRDARCGIAAPMLAEVFRRYAESYGWEVDERGEHDGPSDSSAEEIWDDSLPIVKNKGWGYISETTSTHTQSQAWKKLAASTDSAHPLRPTTPSLGIFYCSHIGKHKYSGNVIVYLPNGAGVWYGRVDPLDGAGRVFEQTILRGKVIPEYLRAGINLYRGEVKVSGSKAEMDGDGEGILRW